MKTWIDAHENENFGNGFEKCEQCKDCLFRTVLLISGKKCERYQNVDCDLFKNKPVEIMRGDAECDFYEKGDPIPQEWKTQNYFSPHNRD